MRRLRLLAFLLCLFCAPHAHAWTKTQVKHVAAGCAVSPCVVALTATGANHFLGVGLTSNSSSSSLGAPPAGACNIAWVHAPNTPATGSGGSFDAYYCLNSVSGITSFSQPITPGGGTVDVAVWEATPSLANFALDSGANPGNKVADAACTSCAGVGLTLSGNADFVIVMSGGGAGGMTALSGTGFTYEFGTAFGDGYGTGLTTGSVTAPATWTQSASGTAECYAIAFQETSAATLHNFTVSPIVP